MAACLRWLDAIVGPFCGDLFCFRNRIPKIILMHNQQSLSVSTTLNGLLDLAAITRIRPARIAVVPTIR